MDDDGGVLVGTVATASMLTGEGAGWSTLALGVTLTFYAIYTLLATPYRVQPAHEPWLSPLVGILTGLITGATGVFVIPAVPYLQSLGFEKDDLVQALGLSFTVSTIALTIGLVSHGAFQVERRAVGSGRLAGAARHGGWTTSQKGVQPGDLQALLSGDAGLARSGDDAAKRRLSAGRERGARCCAPRSIQAKRIMETSPSSAP